MLVDLTKLMGFDLDAKDGPAGSVHDCYFDDRYWHVRYWIGDTGRFLPGRKILLTPQAIEQIDHKSKSFLVALTKSQIKDSPDMDVDLPVSRQREEALHAYYGWAVYWGVYPGVTARAPAPPANIPHNEALEKMDGDPNLRSAREVKGYHIAATDGDIGHVDDFIVQTEENAIRYLVVDTKNWLPGRKVLIAPSWVQTVDWDHRKVRLSATATKQSVERSPLYDPAVPVSKDYEKELHNHYTAPPY